MDEWEIYLDGRGYWRWRRVSSDGKRLVAASTKGFITRIECVENANLNGYEGF